MTTTTRAAVLTGIKQIEVLERPVGPPAPGEVQLNINAVGICGSDLAYWAKGVAGGFKPIDFSATGLCTGYCGQMGHECAGTVVALGEGVLRLKVGDRVALEPGLPCSTCALCRKGRYNLCPKMRFIGSAVNETPGAMVSSFNHPADFCYALPEHVSLAEGAMFEPLCVALNAVRRVTTPMMGATVLVTGAGPIGLMTALAAKAAGAGSITITDMVRAKLDVALALGLDHAFDVSACVDVSTAMEAQFGKFDVCFECCGVASALEICVKAAQSGGCVCVVANYGEVVPTRLQELARREIDLVGVYRYCNLYPTALALVSSGKVDLKPLLSRTFKLADVNEAFAYFATGEPIKVIICPNESPFCLPCAPPPK